MDTWIHPKCQKKIERHAFHAFLLHTEHDEICAVHLGSNGRDLNIMIRIYVFHQSC